MPYSDYRKFLAQYTDPSGLFGITARGDKFVIIRSNDKYLLVYQNGGYDDLKEMWERGEEDLDYIIKLFDNCLSFNRLDMGYGLLVYDSPKYMTLEEIEEALGHRVKII